MNSAVDWSGNQVPPNSTRLLALSRGPSQWVENAGSSCCLRVYLQLKLVSAKCRHGKSRRSETAETFTQVAAK
eukprot:1221254-Prymnesium_polylepis.1